MTKYWQLLCLFFLFNCSKKEVFQISDTTEIADVLEFVETLGGSKNKPNRKIKLPEQNLLSTNLDCRFIIQYLEKTIRSVLSRRTTKVQ